MRQEQRSSEQARVVGRAVLANLEGLVAGGLQGADVDRVAVIARTLSAMQVNPAATRSLLGQLRVLLVPVRGLTARTVLGWLDEVEVGM